MGVAGIGGVAAAEGRPVRGARLLAASDVLREPLGVTLDDVDQAEHERMIADARSQLDRDAWRQACDEGRALSMEEAVEYALGDDD